MGRLCRILYYWPGLVDFISCLSDPESAQLSQKVNPYAGIHCFNPCTYCSHSVGLADFPISFSIAKADTKIRSLYIGLLLLCSWEKAKYPGTNNLISNLFSPKKLCRARDCRIMNRLNRIIRQIFQNGYGLVHPSTFFGYSAQNNFIL